MSLLTHDKDPRQSPNIVFIKLMLNECTDDWRSKGAPKIPKRTGEKSAHFFGEAAKLKEL